MNTMTDFPFKGRRVQIPHSSRIFGVQQRGLYLPIQSKQYFEALSNYKGNLLFVAINYDEDTKKHECEITEWVK